MKLSRLDFTCQAAGCNSVYVMDIGKLGDRQSVPMGKNRLERYLQSQKTKGIWQVQQHGNLVGAVLAHQTTNVVASQT